MDLWSHFASQGATIVTLDAHIREMIKHVKLVYVSERCMPSLKSISSPILHHSFS